LFKHKKRSQSQTTKKKRTYLDFGNQKRQQLGQHFVQPLPAFRAFVIVVCFKDVRFEYDGLVASEPRSVAGNFGTGTQKQYCGNVGIRAPTHFQGRLLGLKNKQRNK